MAENWIKIRTALPDDPRVIAIATELEISVDEAVGKLVRFWGWADCHTTDGLIGGATLEAVDYVTRTPCMAGALVGVGWLDTFPEGLVIPRWEHHMSRSAKARATEARKKRRQREGAQCPEPVPLPPVCPDLVPVRPGLEKEKEKEKEERTTSAALKFPPVLNTPEFRGLWSTWCKYLRKKGKPIVEETAERQLATLAGVGLERAIAALELSIEKGWLSPYDCTPSESRSGGRKPTAAALAEEGRKAEAEQIRRRQQIAAERERAKREWGGLKSIGDLLRGEMAAKDGENDAASLPDSPPPKGAESERDKGSE